MAAIIVLFICVAYLSMTMFTFNLLYRRYIRRCYKRHLAELEVYRHTTSYAPKIRGEEIFTFFMAGMFWPFSLPLNLMAYKIHHEETVRAEVTAEMSEKLQERKARDAEIRQSTNRLLSIEASLTRRS